jgi:hypothetical protein
LTSPTISGLLGQAEGRTSACVIDLLQARTPEFREAIRFVAIDPAAGLRQGRHHTGDCVQRHPRH